MLTGLIAPDSAGPLGLQGYEPNMYTFVCAYHCFLLSLRAFNHPLRIPLIILCL